MKQIVALLIAIAFIGCNKLKEGDVVEKWYEPKREYMMMTPIFISDGKTTTTIYTYYWVEDNEDWVVKIKGIHDGKERTETVYVNQDQYNCLNVGSHLVIGIDCSREDDNNIKTKKP